MKNILKGVGVVAAAGFLGLGLAAPAAADEASFIDDLNANGYTEEVPGGWLEVGYVACNIGNLEDATTYIYNNSGDSVSMDDAQFVAEAAFMFLC